MEKHTSGGWGREFLDHRERQRERERGGEGEKGKRNLEKITFPRM
jgi:hypothetical protein